MKQNRTWNQQEIKKENKILVRKVILNSSPVSRADIANITGLNKGTVSSLVNELIEEKFIYESGQGVSSGGRRPVMLIFNEVAGYSINIDIGVNYLLGAVTDLQGNIYREQKTKISNTQFDHIKKVLFLLIDDLIHDVPHSPYGIIGIGIGIPGTIGDHGNILLAPNLGWSNIDLKSILEARYSFPILIENEANAGAYGEKRYGVGKQFNNLIYLSIGIGIGAGLIINDQLYKGKSGLSGELGHMSIEMSGLKCKCGSEGCWELYASEQSLLKKAKELGIFKNNQEEPSLEDLLSLAEEGHAETIELFKQIGAHIGIGVKNIANIFNPEQIIIGNRLTLAENWIKEPILSKIHQTIDSEQTNLTFLNSKIHSTTLGLAAFLNEIFFNEIS